jgi:hypothetical protein
MLSCNLQDMIAQYSNGGRPGRQQMKSAGQVGLVPALGLKRPLEEKKRRGRSETEGLPAVITGSAGEVKTLDVYVTLKTENNTAAYGAQAWQLSLTAEGGRIKSIGVDGVTVLPPGLSLHRPDPRSPLR